MIARVEWETLDELNMCSLIFSEQHFMQFWFEAKEKSLKMLVVRTANANVSQLEILLDILPAITRIAY